jgi:Uma2 family endonuclease
MSATLPRPRTRHRTRTIPTLATFLRELGDVPPDRIRFTPTPGTATEADLLRYSAEDGTMYELVNGTLVEKAVGMGETKLEGWIYGHFFQYFEAHPIGQAITGTGMIRFGETSIRGPDVSVYLWDSASTPEEDEAHPIARAIPELAVEVISRSNTRAEMALKRREYFAAGTRLVWIVYPKTKTVEVYTLPTRFRTLAIGDTLDGGKLFPGFTMTLERLFNPPTKPTKRKKS